MSDVNLQLVREFFELNVFRVLTNWEQEPWRAHSGDHLPQLFVENTQPVPLDDLPMALPPAELVGIERAVVHIRAWHTDRFYPSVIEASPVLSKFEAEEALTIARHVFSNQPFVTILVISELPVSADLRARSLNLLREAGVDHVLEFPHILRDLLNRISAEGNYSASPTLQTLRLLKRYKLVRNQQLEFSFVWDPPPPATVPQIEAADITSGEDDE